MLCRFGCSDETAPSGHGLVERGVDATVGRHLGQQGLAVGGAQLLDLAVAQEVLDDRVLAEQLLQRGRVGGLPVLIFFCGVEAELLVEDLAQLLGRADVERLGRTSWIGCSSASRSLVRSAVSSLSPVSTRTPTASMSASTRTSGSSTAS